MRLLTHPEHGRVISLGGRIHPPPMGPHFKFANYHVSIPTPNYVDYSWNSEPSLGNIFGNDVAGDCTIAAAAHTEGVWTGNAGALFVPTLEEVFAMYSACEGPPGYPAADNGCDEITVLNYWVKKGLAGRKPAMWMTVDHTNMNDCRAALFLFENLYICAYLPDAWVDPFPAGNGFTWNVEGPPVMNNGHAWMAYGYDFRKIGSKAFKIDTWGMQGRLTAPALMKYTDPAPGTYGGLYSVLSWDIINRAQQRAPNGFNWQQLKSDFAAMS